MTTETENKIDRPEWLPTEVWPFLIRSIEVDGNTISYTDEGSGPVMLLVHDGMWSYVWGQLIGLLRKDFRVITLDFPGSGLSPGGNIPTSLAADSRLLEAFVENLKITNFTLVLHDLGGVVGLGLAVKRPELVGGLVLINTFAWPPHRVGLRAMFAVVASRPVRALNVATNLLPKMSAGEAGIGRQLDSVQRAAFLGGFKTKGQRRRFHDLMGSVREETGFLVHIESALTSTLSNTPVLTIYGGKNDPFGFQEKFHEYFSNIDEMVIPGGNHFPMTDDPEGVAERIAVWHQHIPAL